MMSLERLYVGIIGGLIVTFCYLIPHSEMNRIFYIIGGACIGYSVGGN